VKVAENLLAAREELARTHVRGYPRPDLLENGGWTITPLGRRVVAGQKRHGTAALHDAIALCQAWRRSKDYWFA
jgi:hypothetical protein